MTFKTALVRVGQVALIAAVTYGIIRALAPELSKVSAEDFLRWRPHIGLLLLSQAMLVGFFLFHCWLWRNILNRMSDVRPGLKSVLRMFFLAGLGRYIPGRLWQIAGLAMFARQAGVSAVTATAAVLVGQLAWLTTGLVFLVLLLRNWEWPAPQIAAIATTALAAGVFLGLTVTKAGHDLRAWITRRSERFGNALMLLDRIRIRDALLWWLGYLISWAFLGAAFVVMVYAFVPLDPTAIVHVAGTIAASYLAGYIAFFSVSGLGIREAAMVVLLSQVMPASAALVVSVVARLWFTAGELLPLLLIPITKENHGSAA